MLAAPQVRSFSVVPGVGALRDSRSVVCTRSHANREIVRKKAVMVFERFYSRAPDMVSHLSESFRRVLLDKDPSVMGATLCLYHRMVLVRPPASGSVGRQTLTT